MRDHEFTALFMSAVFLLTMLHLVRTVRMFRMVRRNLCHIKFNAESLALCTERIMMSLQIPLDGVVDQSSSIKDSSFERTTVCLS